MIDRVISTFVRNGITRIVIVTRTDATAIKDHVTSKGFAASIEFVEEDTRSGLFSFFAMERALAGESFLLSTTDVVCDEDSVARFIDFCRTTPSADVIMSVTEFVMDEKPVYAQLDENRIVRAFGRKFASGGKFVSAGMYFCSPVLYNEKQDALRSGIEHLSDYFGWIVAKGYKVLAFPISKVVDVDDEEDLREAESFLACDSDSAAER